MFFFEIWNFINQFKKRHTNEIFDKKDELITKINEKIEKANKDNENEEDDVIKEDLKIKNNIIENHKSLKEKEIDNKLKGDNKKNQKK